MHASGGAGYRVGATTSAGLSVWAHFQQMKMCGVRGCRGWVESRTADDSRGGGV